MKLSFYNSIPPRYKKLAVWMVSIASLYTLIGFVLLPPIGRVIVVKQLSKFLDRPVTIQKVWLNPYRLSATIQGLSIKAKDGSSLASCDEAYLNFQLASLFTGAWVFKEVSLSQPFLRVQVNRDNTLNLSDIIDTLSSPASSKTAEPGKLHSLRISRLRFTRGQVSFADLTPRIAFQRTIDPVELTITHFQTDSDHKNAFALSGIAGGGEQFSWNGFFQLAPLRSEGELSIHGFALTTYAPLYQDLFRFEIKDGVVDLHSTYRYETSAATNLLAVTNATFALKSLQLVEKDTSRAVVEVATFFITGASVDAMSRQAEADTLTMTGGHFALRRNRDTSVNVIELWKPADGAPPAPGGILLLLRAMTNLVAMLLNSTNLSNGVIRDLNVTNCAVHMEDLVNSQPVRLDLEGIVIHGTNVSNRAGTNMTGDISLRWDTNGIVRAGIKAGLSPPTAEMELALDKLNLRPLAPYLEPYLDIVVLGSKLGLAGTLRLSSRRDELPEVRFHGDAWLDDFSTAGGIATEGLLEWNSLRLSDIEASLNPPVVSVANVKLDDLFARLIIDKTRTLNLMSALRRGGSNETAVLASTNAVGSVRARVSLASMVFSNASVHFVDRSLQPNVNIHLEQLNGTLAGLSSDDPQRADLHLHGTVDRTAAAEVTGQINPWNSRQPMDLKLSLQGLDLLPGDPYSGKYLGYRLTKGKLSAQLTYQLTERKLKSENRLTLDNLTLGPKVDSPDATRLPVRLAIALMKDRDGRIALDLPVDGSLDDPQFSLGKVVYRALETVMVKIVTSPFSALGALFGGQGEDLSFQEFQPGSTSLSPASIAKLDILANSLHERPDLQLEIEGSADPVTDLRALRRAKLHPSPLVEEWNGPLSSAATNPAVTGGAPPRSSRFSFEKGASALRSPSASPTISSKSTFPDYPTPGPPRTFADTKGATALMLIFAPVVTAPDPGWDRQLLETVEISPDAVPTLALERARNVKAYLVQTGKIEPQRITESARGDDSKGSRVYLRLQ